MPSQTLPAIWKTLEELTVVEDEEEEEHVLNIGLAQSQDGFPVSDPNYPISRASKPPKQRLQNSTSSERPLRS